MDDDDFCPSSSQPRAAPKYGEKKALSFRKIIESIGGASARFSRHYTVQDDSNVETFFTEALTKWNDQDHSSHFVEFGNKLPSDELKTYAQLLHHRRMIMDLLLQHMLDESSKSTPAFCELMTALAKDLKDEFYEYMWESFDAIVHIFDFGDRDKDTIESAYFCLSMLVKILWRKLAKNIKKSFGHFMPLFGNSKEYVRRFAAEAVAFLLRKVDDLRGIVRYLVTQAYNSGESRLIDGMGSLLFNVYNGIGGGYHSSASSLLTDIVNGVLAIDDLSIREYGSNILERMLHCNVAYIQRSKVSTASLSIPETVLTGLLKESGTMCFATHLARLIPILFVERRQHFIFTKEQELLQAIQTVLKCSWFSLNENFLSFISLCVHRLFADSTWNIAVRDVFKILLSPDVSSEAAIDLKLDALNSLIDHGSFDLYILPLVGSLSTSLLQNHGQFAPKLIHLLAKTCSIRRPLADVIKNEKGSFFDVSQHVALRNYVSERILSLKSLSNREAGHLIIVWSCIYGLADKIQGIAELTEYLTTLLNKEDISLEQSQLVYITTASLFKVNKRILEDIEIAHFEKFVRIQSCSESSIRSLLFRLNVSRCNNEAESMERVLTLLTPAMFSANNSTRIAAIEVLSQFSLLKEGSGATTEEGDLLPEPEGVFNILAEAERCDIKDPRGRLMYLRKLNYGLHVKHLTRGLKDLEEKAIVNVCLAQYFVQYTLLWPGLFETLNTFARGMNIDIFWSILGNALHIISQNCRTQGAMLNSSCFSELLPNMDEIARKDFITARIQILKFIEKIADLAERRTRILSPLMLDIYEHDFVNRLMEENNICATSNQERKDENEDNRQDAEEENVDSLLEETKWLPKKDFIKTITAFMNVFAKFGDARSVYLEPKLRRMYEHLLTDGILAIQTSALNCIFGYKDKAVNQYRDQLAALHEDKGFSEQLSLLSIDERMGETILAADHRKAVMPILLRLLYGKLKQKVKGTRRTARPATIFRYLSGCRPDELQIFLSIAFSSIIDVVGTDADMVNKMKAICQDISTVERIRVTQILQDVNHIAELLKVSSSVSEEQQSFILRILLSIGVVVKSVLENNDTPIYRRNHARELRMNVANSLAAFFSAFPDRNHSTTEVLNVLDVCILSGVTDQKSKNNVESVPFVNESALRILNSWAAIPSLYHLFTLRVNVAAVRNEKFSMLDLFVSPLVANALTPSMLTIIRAGLLNMLRLADESMQHLSDVDYMIVPEHEGVNFGTKVLVAHINKILVYLSEALETDRSSAAFDQNLEILNRLSDFIEDEGVLGLKMASTLLSSLERKIPGEETAVKMFGSIGRLVRYVENPLEFLKRITQFLSTLLGRQCREALCSVLLGLSTNKHLDSETKEQLIYAVDLEKWDKRRVDEPDHDSRHAAYSTLTEMWSSSKLVDVNMLRIFAHQHAYVLFNLNDIALRSASTSNFRAIIEYVNRIDYPEEIKSSIVDKTLISLTLRGFQNELETVREESFRHLSCLVDVFPSHSQLSPLQQLKNTDEDLDFFINFNHIQSHRRQRALARLCTQLKEGKVSLPFDVLSRFFLPLTVHHILKYDSKTSAMSDQCLTLLTITMGIAPWSRYSAAMEHWLGRFENPRTTNDKPIVRALVAVIDAFHYEVADAAVVAEDPDHPSHPITIRDKIQGHIMPRLQKCINGKGSTNAIHKKARTAGDKHQQEDDDIERAPVILATVKLLAKLPESVRNQYLHGVILKMCRLLIAGSISVRETARKIAIQVVDVLGPKYLPFIIKEMKMIMTAGFHIIVLIFTVHAFVSSLQSRLQVGDLDSCLSEIMELSIKDQFELAGAEKEIGAIRAKTPEAKSNRTPDTFLLLGKFVSSASLGLVLQKLMPIVQTKVSSKNLLRIGDLLTKFAHGVKDNAGLTSHMQLILVHQILKENIEKMENLNKKEKDEMVDGLRQNCLIIPEAPKRIGALVKTSIKSRLHVFVEFALLLLAQLINDRRFDSESPEDIAGLDPFVPLITRCLHLKYDKIISHSLKCVSGLLYMDLPSLKSQLRSLTERLFVLRSDYAIIGNAANKTSVLQLNQLIYKSFTQIIKMSEATFLDKKHVALLLNSIEADVLDTQRQATAFSLIKTLVKKQVRHESITEVMKQLSEMSITNHFPHIRTQCRDVVSDFIAHHPDSGDIRDHLQFFAAQLDYEYEDGRLSAAETLHKLFTILPSDSLDAHCMFLVVKLSAAMMNDEIVKCRKFFSLTLRQLLSSTSESTRQEVASAAYDWLRNNKDSTRCVGINVLVQQSHVEKSSFASRLPLVVSAVADRLSSDEVISENSEYTLVTTMDGLILMLQNSAEKSGDIACTDEFYKLIGTIGELSKCPESIDVRRASSALLGQALSMWGTKLKEDHTPSLETMVSWMFWQLRDNKLERTVAEQCSKNLVALSSLLTADKFVEFIKTLSGICRFEISHAPKESVKRIHCLKMAAAISVRSDSVPLETILDEFFPLIVRELNRKSKYDTEELYTLASEIGDLLKSRLGDDIYNKRLGECQKALIVKTEERKRKAKELVVTNPVEAATIKQKKNKKKTESRKRKLDVLKPYRIAKRRNLESKRLQRDEDD